MRELRDKLWDGARRKDRVYVDQFTFYQCGTCGIVWAMPNDYLDTRRDDQQGWCCPNGHEFHYTGKSDKEKLREQLDAERDRAARLAAQRDQARAEAEHERRSAAATRGHLTRKKRQLDRVANGVCPCCNRSFANLGRHMKSKHPDFQPVE